MKKMLVLLFVFAVISASAHAAIQVKLTVVSNTLYGKISVVNKTTNQQVLTCPGTTPCNISLSAGTKVKISTDVQTVPFSFAQWAPVSGSAAACQNLTPPAGLFNVVPCEFTITQDSSATAKYVETFHLRVAGATGSGPGTIRVKDGHVTKIECTKTLPQGECSSRFLIDSNITIENVPGPNQQFGGYATKTGSAQACTSSTCKFVLKADTIVFSNFVQIP